MASEANIQQEIRLALSGAGHLIFRNNIGAYKCPKTGRLIRYGVGDKGGSDLIGITKSGRFLAIEVKSQTGRVRPDQTNFILAIRSKGGYAGVARSAEDALRIAEGEVL